MELTQVAEVRLPIDLDAASLGTLERALQEAMSSTAPIVALTGAAPDTFCIGLAIGSSPQAGAPTHAFSDLLTLMHESPKPLMAVIDGRCIGGGMGLACACDCRRRRTGPFALPELLWGWCPPSFGRC